jgi:hypothetical protein
MHRIWRLVAFLGRYGHQPVEGCLGMTFPDLCSLAESVGELLREESDAMRKAADG